MARLHCKWLSGLVFLGGVASCDIDLGERPVASPRSFGEVFYTAVCDRLAYSGELDELALGRRQSIDASGVRYRGTCRLGEPPPAGAPLVLGAGHGERAAIIGSIDAALPAPLPDRLDVALRAMLPAIDSDDSAAAARGAGEALLLLADDAQAVAGLGRVPMRRGFRPPSADAAFSRALLGYADLHPTLLATLPALWPSVPGAGDAPGAPARAALLAALGREFRAAAAVPRPDAPDRTLRLSLRLFLGESPELRTLPSGQGVFAVLRDARGLPEVSRPGDRLPAQFLDADRDGAPDVDARGRFLASGGGLLPEVTPFPLSDTTAPPGPAPADDHAVARDAAGRALVSPGGATLYRYQDLDDTVLAALLREVPALLDPERDVTLRLLRGAGHLLGPRQETTRDYPADRGGPLTYSGYDGARGPLLDLVYSFAQVLGYTSTGAPATPGTDGARLLRGLTQLFASRESEVARSLLAMSRAFDEAKKPAYAGVALAEDATLYDDLAPVLVRLLRQPGLVTDLLDALQKPESADLGQIFALLMTDRGAYFMNQGQPDWQKPGAVTGGPSPVDRARPDGSVSSDPKDPRNNRSVLQRVLQIVHDASELTLCNKEGARVNFDLFGIPIKISGPAAACTLFRLDDLATYYLLSLADTSVKQRDDYCNFLTAILDGTLRTGAGALELIGKLDKLIGIPGFSRYPAPPELARILFQSAASRADFFRDSLDLGACEPQRPGTLCSNRNLSWTGYYDGALFALESIHPRDASGNLKTGVTFYTAFRPIVNAFARRDECIAKDVRGVCIKKRNAAKILVDLLAVLHRHWSTVESQFYDQGYDAQTRALKIRSGLSRYEPLLSAQLGQGDLWASSLALAGALSALKIDDGSGVTLGAEVAQFVRWFMDPEAPRLSARLAYRDGRTTAVRGDGAPTFRPTGDPIVKDVIDAGAAGRVTPYDLLADAFRRKRARLAEDPDQAAAWQGGVSALADLYLTAAQRAGQTRYGSPRMKGVLTLVLAHLRERLLAHGAAGDLAAWLTDPRSGLFGGLAESLTGPIFAAASDTARALSEVPASRRGLLLLLSALVRDPGPDGDPAERARFQAVLLGLADFLQLLLDDPDVVPIVRALAPLLAAAPAPGPGSARAAASGPGAIDGLLALLRRALPLDTEQVLLSLAKNLVAAAGPGAPAPYAAAVLTDAVAEIGRVSAGAPGLLGTDLAEADLASIARTAGTFLLDHQRGLPRILDILHARAAGPSLAADPAPVPAPAGN